MFWWRFYEEAKKRGYITSKKEILREIFIECEQKSNFVFDNNLIKKKSGDCFKNQFDVTKVDTKDKLHKDIIQSDYCLIHLGNGKHKFVKGVNKIYHIFEDIPESNIINWNYKKSILNEFNTSESNILSVANNQRILHTFLFEEDREFDNSDVLLRPKTYFPHRTKTCLNYKIDGESVVLYNIQIEIDLTIEHEGIVNVFEAKNGDIDNFNVTQIYYPFLYYYNAKLNNNFKDKIKTINCVYLLKYKENNNTVLKLYKYTFDNPEEITSIKLLDSKKYILIKEGM